MNLRYITKCAVRYLVCFLAIKFVMEIAYLYALSQARFPFSQEWIAYPEFNLLALLAANGILAGALWVFADDFARLAVRSRTLVACGIRYAALAYFALQLPRAIADAAFWLAHRSIPPGDMDSPALGIDPRLDTVGRCTALVIVAAVFLLAPTIGRWLARQDKARTLRSQGEQDGIA